MDIIKKKNKKSPKLLWKANVLIVLAIITLILAYFVIDRLDEVSIDRQNLLIETVQQGDLDVIVEGYGTLVSDKQQLITSFSPATVKEVLLKPGAQVTANSVIARLENPELVQKVENAEQELILLQANLRQLKLNNQREILDESATLAALTALYDSAELKRKAEEKLVKLGIVSQLTFQQSVLDEKQLKQRIEIYKARLEQLNLVHEESVNIQLERVKQQKGILNIASSRLEKLNVRAGFDGVLQRLSIELGQSLAPGQEVALIGSVTDLIALIRVPQNQAQLVTIGSKVIIDTRRDKIEGLVSRVDPVVENNTVEIEIDLPDTLPASARPQLNVDGVIIADTLQNVLYIKRPAGAKSNTSASLYRLDTNSNAKSQDIRYGTQAGQFIQITSGASAGEKFIISDLSNIQSTNQTLTIY